MNTNARPGRRFTDSNVRRILAGWPQAVSADGGDFRMLHDMANAGAQGWGEKLQWPDYFWSPLNEPVGSNDLGRVVRHGVAIAPPPGGTGPDADLGVINKARIEAPRPPETASISGRLDCVVELKAIQADHVPKLRGYPPGLPWPKYLHSRLGRIFLGRIREADDQIRDGKRLTGLVDARGVTVVVNEGSPSLTPEMAYAYLARVIQGLPNTDVIVYLADRPKGQRQRPFIFKNPNDDRAQRFSSEFLMMVNQVDWKTGEPRFPCGPYPRLVARIEMDERSRAMYRAWSTGWRDENDRTPIPRPRLRLWLEVQAP